MIRSGRNADELRKIVIDTNIDSHAEGACLISYGNTKVLCTASVEDNIPNFLKGKNQGWISAEYGMLPRATHTRTKREAAQGKQTGRTQEIQRLIGRSLRAALDLNLLGERQILIDCDVLNADGGTRTAAITGGYLALHLACQKLLNSRTISKTPIKHKVVAVSCGIVGDEVLLDLDYQEDSNIDIDANFVMNALGDFIEVQITAEHKSFNIDKLNKMAELARKAGNYLLAMQQEAIDKYLNT
jgi:ribonuclease PH